MSEEKSSALRVIVGLGQTGLSCARYLAQMGTPFAVMDTRVEPPALRQLKTEFPHVQLFLGGLDGNLLAQAGEIIVSPGVSVHEPLLTECAKKQIPIIGDIELFAKAARAPICAITGSNGKSTVTSLVGAMARCASLNVRVGANLGTPALGLLKNTEPDWYVLELSSFQLETTYSLSPAVATILNISPDHMDRYTNLAEYIAAKLRIYRGCEFIVWNRDDNNTVSESALGGISNISFGLNEPQSDEFGIIFSDAGPYLAFGEDRLLPVCDLALKGSHNWGNALAALSLGYAMALPMSAMLRTLQTFPGLPHRCQWVTERNGISWYNDSKGTNVGASVAALKGLAAGIMGKVILIAGGQGKGADFSELRKPVAETARVVILIGEDAPKIEQALNGASTILHSQSLEEAVSLAAQQARHGDAVLLSPACASFDMFKNFEHRGEVFMAAVRELLQ